MTFQNFNVTIGKKEGKQMLNQKNNKYEPTIDTLLCTLLLGKQLTEPQIEELSKLTEEELAARTVNITYDFLKAIEDPKDILNAAATIFAYSNKNQTEQEFKIRTQSFQLNMKWIEAKRQQNTHTENGPTR